MVSTTESTAVPAPEDLDALLRSRRTINLFEPEPVAEELLLGAIDVARWAPNHKLTQPWRFYVVSQATKEKIARCAADIDAAAKGERVGQARYERLMAVPATFVVTSRIGNGELMDLEDYAAACCAVQNLTLSLWSRGVGVKWTTGAVTREPAFYELVGVDAGAERVIGYFWYGTPKLVPEQKRKPVDDIVRHV
ncbi:MAG: nitroreductase [Gammaproteobacteria bacterium]|jgi:nitroreductase